MAGAGDWLGREREVRKKKAYVCVFEVPEGSEVRDVISLELGAEDVVKRILHFLEYTDLERTVEILRRIGIYFATIRARGVVRVEGSRIRIEEPEKVVVKVIGYDHPFTVVVVTREGSVEDELDRRARYTIHVLEAEERELDELILNMIYNDYDY